MIEQPKHVAAYEFYRDMQKRSYRGVTKAFSVSETSVKKWSREFNWKTRIAVWDNAVREGVEAGALESLVDTRIEEIEQLSKAMSEIDTVMPMIFDALQSATYLDEETGRRKVKIVPETTQDMAALYNAQTRFVAAKVKLVETVRKIRGEPDKVEVTGSLKHDLTAEPDILKAANELAQKLSKR
jgi:uncharacterized protein YjcR